MSKRRIFATTCLTIAVGACSSVPAALPVRPRPVAMPQTNAVRPSEFAYQAAVGAVKERDYKDALNSLQVAVAQDPTDARPLNALGIVYDKLGMFNVGRRYYGQALVLDPASETVRHNLAYSKEMEQQALADRIPDRLVAAVEPSQPTASQNRTVEIASAEVLRPHKPSREMVSIVDGSGSAKLGEQVRRRLVARKWVATFRNLHSGVSTRESVIRYDPRLEKLALALSRTLPVDLRIVPDESVEGVVLHLGQDAANWGNRVRA